MTTVHELHERLSALICQGKGDLTVRTCDMDDALDKAPHFNCPPIIDAVVVCDRDHGEYVELDHV